MTATGEQQPDIHALRINRTDSPTPSRKGFGWKVYGTIALVLTFAVLVYAFSNLFSTVLEVETTTAAMTSPSEANSVLTASGYVVARQKASIASKGTGRLIYLGVEEGDRVNKGEIIARLEDQDVSAALLRAQADLELARADSFDAANSYARERTLFDSGLSSKAALDGAQARMWRTDAAIQAARATVGEALVALENTRIRAPFDGTVLTKDADVGEVVAPFASSANSRAAVVTMADMSSLEVEADVSESNITRVSAGQPCDIILDAYPGHRYPGYVHKIVPTADRAKATVLTKVRFWEKDDRVLPEMSAKVSFLVGENVETRQASEPVLAVREAAVTDRNGSTVVFLVNGSAVHEVPVRTGMRIGEKIQILEGLSSGDVVVVHPPQELTDGSRITVR